MTYYDLIKVLPQNEIQHPVIVGKIHEITDLVPGMAALPAHVLKLTMYVQNQDYDGNITVSPGISTRW